MPGAIPPWSRPRFRHCASTGPAALLSRRIEHRKCRLFLLQQAARHWLNGRVLVGAVAAVVALVAGIVIGIEHGSTSTPAAKVLLAAVGQLPSSASGAAQMVGQGEDQSMLVTLSGLDRPPPGDHYEVWLLDTRTGRTFAVGVVSPSVTGKMAYPLPATKAVGFDTIDVSLQTPANGAKHSGVSLLRGAIS